MHLLPNVFGKLPDGKRLDRIKQSPNYSNGEFKNMEPTVQLAEGASVPGILLDAWKAPKDCTPSKPIAIDGSGISILDNQKVAITWFGHSSYLLQVMGKNILVDPVFSKRASFSNVVGPKRFPGVNFELETLPTVDIVLLTHDHYDHLDYQVMLRLKESVKQFIMPLGVGAHLEHWGVKPDRITELDWWDETILGEGLTIAATPARHFSGRTLPRKTLWASFVLKSMQHKLYIGGDSGYGIHFNLIGEKYGPFDIALLDSGQYNASWPYIHMQPEQTVQAAIDLRAKLLMPIHWGKFKLAFHPWNEPPDRVVAEAVNRNMPLVIPRIGSTIRLGEEYSLQEWWKD
ncbi:MAG: MBL fold metallo-hydrolase [Chitinophagales bacterium]|nr:MBL fold metallo-hydrolase [Chitinophagales bacterium]